MEILREWNIWQDSNVSFLVRGAQNLFGALGYIKIWGILHCKFEIYIPDASQVILVVQI